MPVSRSLFRLLKRRPAWVGAAASTAFLFVGGALYSRLPAQEQHEEREIAPGLTLLSVQTIIPQGRLRYWLVKADRARWNLSLQVANAQDVMRKRTVRSLATQAGATVAINGGFFAYSGAAVGAVKVAGNWQRLPWRSRTALGWNKVGARIDPLSGSCRLSLTRADGTTQEQEAAFNGFTLPGSRAPIGNGYIVLTSQFAPRYKLQSGEVGALVQNGQVGARLVVGSEAALPTDGFLLVAHGDAASTLSSTDAATALRSANWKIATSGGWDEFDQILGAGPRLVRDGVPATTEVAEEFQPDVVARGPRTCVGWDKDHNWLFLVADGWRPNESMGLNLPETGALFQQLGAVQALNLDGGSSTQLVVNHELLNHPTGFDPVNPTRTREVQVSNALMLKPN